MNALVYLPVTLALWAGFATSRWLRWRRQAKAIEAMHQRAMQTMRLPFIVVPAGLVESIDRNRAESDNVVPFPGSKDA